MQIINLFLMICTKKNQKLSWGTFSVNALFTPSKPQKNLTTPVIVYRIIKSFSHNYNFTYVKHSSLNVFRLSLLLLVLSINVCSDCWYERHTRGSEKKEKKWINKKDCMCMNNNCFDAWRYLVKFIYKLFIFHRFFERQNEICFA